MFPKYTQYTHKQRFGPKRIEYTKETTASRHNSTDALVNSQRLWQHSQGLHRSKTQGVLVLREEVDIHPVPSIDAISN